MTFDATFNESNQTIYADFGEVSVLGSVQVAGVKIGYIKLLASAWEGETSPKAFSLSCNTFLISKIKSSKVEYEFFISFLL